MRQSWKIIQNQAQLLTHIQNHMIFSRNHSIGKPCGNRQKAQEKKKGPKNNEKMQLGTRKAGLTILTCENHRKPSDYRKSYKVIENYRKL